MTDRRLPERHTIPDLIAATGNVLTDRQIRHWLDSDWCFDAEKVHVGGRLHVQWQFGSSGWLHALEMARLFIELRIHPPVASEIAAALVMTGEYVTDHFSLYATRRLVPEQAPEEA